MSKKIIRFITPGYEKLFDLEDGGKIKINFPGGEFMIKECEYLDETHMRVKGPTGGYVYHICEFAEKMRRAGNRVEKVSAE